MATEKWTKEDDAKATAQGWGVVNVSLDEPDYVQRIAYPDDGSNPIFESDDQALEFVQKRAKDGCPTAKRALRMCGQKVGMSIKVVPMLDGKPYQDRRSVTVAEEVRDLENRYDRKDQLLQTIFATVRYVGNRKIWTSVVNSNGIMEFLAAMDNWYEMYQAIESES